MPTRPRAHVAARIFLAGALASLAACSSTPSVKDMTVRMRDTDDVRITDMRSIRASGLLSVQVTVVNRGAKRPVAYRFRWLDGNSLQVGGDEAWKPLTVTSGQTGLLTGVAPHPAATDFRFELTSE